MLGFRDTGIISDDESVKIWKRPDGDLVALSNQNSVPSYVLVKLLDEMGFEPLNLYGSQP